MIFANPAYLWLLLLLVPAVLWYVFRQQKGNASIEVSSTSPFEKMPRSYKYYLRHVRFALELAAAASLIIALARPQSTDSWTSRSTEGVDIVLALDISTSMLARDFNPNRVDAAKDVAAQFVSGRPYDNIGLVIFAGESFTMCPMTTDHAALLNLLRDVECGMIEDMTAIGDGLATAISRIKDGPAKSKTIILLTDGTNNAGDISPMMAAEIANEIGGAEFANAKKWLKKVRTRAFKGHKSEAETYVDNLTEGESFFNAIVDERALEFVGEFLRKGDLIRWNLLDKKLRETEAELKGVGKDPEVAGRYLWYRYGTDENGVTTIEMYGLDKSENAATADEPPAGTGWQIHVNSEGNPTQYFPEDLFGDKKQLLFDASKLKDVPDMSNITVDGPSGRVFQWWPIFETSITNSQNTLKNDYGF